MVVALDPSLTVFLVVFGGGAAVIGTFFAGHRRGSDRTKKEWKKRLDNSNENWERKLEQERQRQQQLSAEDYGKEKVKTHFRAKIEWIKDMKSDLNDEMNLLALTSEQERKIYQSLIKGLDIQKKELERSRDLLAD